MTHDISKIVVRMSVLLAAVLVGAGVVSLVTADQNNPGKATPDYSKLSLKGDEHARDSFSLTVEH